MNTKVYQNRNSSSALLQGMSLVYRHVTLNGRWKVEFGKHIRFPFEWMDCVHRAMWKQGEPSLKQTF